MLVLITNVVIIDCLLVGLIDPSYFTQVLFSNDSHHFKTSAKFGSFLSWQHRQVITFGTFTTALIHTFSSVQAHCAHCCTKADQSHWVRLHVP